MLAGRMGRELGLVMSGAEEERGCESSEGSSSGVVGGGDDTLTSLSLRALVLSRHIFSCSH